MGVRLPPESRNNKPFTSVRGLFYLITLIIAVFPNSSCVIIGYFVLLSTSSIRLVFGGEAPKLVAFISMIFSPSCSLYFIFLRLFLVLTSFNTVLPFIIKVILSPSSLFASQIKNLSFLLSQLIVKSSPSFNICVLLTGEVSSLSFSICFSI